MGHRCKLFDAVAFGRHRYSEDKQDRFLLAIDDLRASVLVDASSLSDPFDCWLSRNKDPESEFQSCFSPFDNAFYYAGNWKGGHPVGVHLQRFRESDKDYRGSGVKIWDAIMQSLREDVILARDEEAPRNADDLGNAKEIHRLTVWSLYPPAQVRVCKVITYVALGDRGQWLCCFAGAHRSRLTFGDSEEPARYYQFALFASQLMQCRNIIVRNEPAYRPNMPKGQRNRAPKIDYKTIGMSESLVRSSRDSEAGDGTDRRRHVCRGNFAHYTDERPLFGKYTGTFWRPMHVRGKAEAGVVQKDYTM